MPKTFLFETCRRTPHPLRGGVAGTKFASNATIFVLCATLLLGVGCAKPKVVEKELPPPLPVEYVVPIYAEVTKREEFSGRTWAMKTVELRARVSGYLEKINFRDGDTFTSDTVLFEIEDDVYTAERDQAKANVDQMIAQVDRLQSQLNRSKKLIVQKATTQEDLDILGFQVNEAQASVESAKAALKKAELNVAFTKVHTPFVAPGSASSEVKCWKIGRRLVDEGNLVEEDKTALATLVTLDPIYAYFDIDERTLLAMRQTKIGDSEMPRIEIALAGDSATFSASKIDWQDNQIDQGTGTLRSRVTIDNPDHLLSPGMFVRLKVPVDAPSKMLTIPEAALFSDQGQRKVFVAREGKFPKNPVPPAKPAAGTHGDAHGAKPDHPAADAKPEPPPEMVDGSDIEVRSVQIGWLEGDQRVILSGLTPKDRVVVSPLQQIRASARVEPKLRGPNAAPAPSVTKAAR